MRVAIKNNIGDGDDRVLDRVGQNSEADGEGFCINTLTGDGYDGGVRARFKFVLRAYRKRARQKSTDGYYAFKCIFV